MDHYNSSSFLFAALNGNPLQYSCLENPMDGGAWWATVHGVSKSRTRLSDFTHSNSEKPGSYHLPSIYLSCSVSLYMCNNIRTVNQSSS